MSRLSYTLYNDEIFFWEGSPCMGLRLDDEELPVEVTKVLEHYGFVDHQIDHVYPYADGMETNSNIVYAARILGPLEISVSPNVASEFRIRAQQTGTRQFSGATINEALEALHKYWVRGGRKIDGVTFRQAMKQALADFNQGK